MSNIAKLDAAIRAVCPIHGVNSDRVISFDAEATQDQRIAAQAIADTWVFSDAHPERRIESWQFRDRFTEVELDGILGMAYSGDAIARRLLLKVQTATGGIDLDSPEVIGGLDYLVTQGVLTAERAAVIRA